jgi:hypothetical protein
MLPYLQKDLACGEGTRLDCCNMIATTSDYVMAIITLGRLYSTLSCRLAPTDAMSVQHGQRVGSGATFILTGTHLSSGVGSEVLWTRFLVGFWCENTCHVENPDPSSGQDQTYPCHLARGAPMAELAVGQGVGPGPDPTSHHGLHQGSVSLAWY